MSTQTPSLHDAFNSATPAGAYDDLLARVLPQAKAQRPQQDERYDAGQDRVIVQFPGKPSEVPAIIDPGAGLDEEVHDDVRYQQLKEDNGWVDVVHQISVEVGILVIVPSGLLQRPQDNRDLIRAGTESVSVLPTVFMRS